MKLTKLYTVEIPNTVNFKETSQLCGDIGDQPNQPTKGAHLFINSKIELQTMAGIGGSFSELGGKAIKSLDEAGQAKVGESLFKDKFNFFRLPVGASDFGIDAYSLSETADDFEMEHFSLERDEKYLIPYMEIAKKYCEDMKIHASPWSPPHWLKDNNQMGSGGSVIDKPEYYKAYAKYFAKLVEKHAEKGFNIARINIQNEPDVDPLYPSCIFPPKQMGMFITEYMKPYFEELGLDTEIFAGTFRSINGASACDFLTENDGIENVIDGIGVQYCMMQPIHNIFAKYPNLKIMHTESNCFHGENSWEQAITLYINIVNYLSAGCDVFTYWNMILNQESKSSWGWNQNSLITIDENEKTIRYNPDYYIMTLAAECIKPNSVRVSYSSMNKIGFAVKNEDGSINFMVSNFSDKEEKGDITVDGVKLDITLAPMSIETYRID